MALADTLDMVSFSAGGYRFAAEAQQIDAMLHDGLNDAFSNQHSGWVTEDLVAQFGISRSYVSRLEKHALARLRRAWNQPHPL